LVSAARRRSGESWPAPSSVYPLFVFNQLGDLEHCELRPGNVHNAHGWRETPRRRCSSEIGHSSSDRCTFVELGAALLAQADDLAVEDAAVERQSLGDAGGEFGEARVGSAGARAERRRLALLEVGEARQPSCFSSKIKLGSSNGAAIFVGARGSMRGTGTAE